MREFMDILTKVQIDLEALSIALKRPDFDKDLAAGEQMTDEDYCAAIRIVFGEHEEFEERLVPLLLQAYRKAAALERSMEKMCDRVLNGARGRTLWS